MKKIKKGDVVKYRLIDVVVSAVYPDGYAQVYRKGNGTRVTLPLTSLVKE